MRVAVVEHELRRAGPSKAWLEQAGHKVLRFESSRDFLRTVERESFDSIIMDWRAPDPTGVRVLFQLRKHAGVKAPILFVATRSDEEGRVAMLQAGADDCLAKPFGRSEFVARVEALNRLGTGLYGHEEVMEIPPYRFNLKVRNIELNDEVLDVTDREFDLALFMFLRDGHTLSRTHILETLWGRVDLWNTRTVDTHISRIRRKLRIRPENGWAIRSIYQRGYRLDRLAVRDKKSSNGAGSWRDAPN